MTPLDRQHAEALELAESIAAGLARLEEECELLPKVDKLWGLVAELAGQMSCRANESPKVASSLSEASPR